MKSVSLKLSNLLIGKAVIETVLVGIVAVVSYVNLFPPTFHGWGEVLPQSRSLAGWAVNNSSPWERVEVQLFVDNKFSATQMAALSRPDVQSAGWSRDEWHGYSFQLNHLGSGVHEARVYALHQTGDGARYTLQLLGDPMVFEVDQNFEWHRVSTK
jgi:hypothetical protein